MWKRPIVNTMIQVIAKAVMILIALVTTGILTRKLGVAGYGNFVLLSSIFLLLDALADMGTKIIGVREASTKENIEEENRIYVTVWRLRTVTTLMGFVIGIGLIFGWQGLSEIKPEAIVALSMMWLTMAAGNLEMVFQKRQRMDLKTVMDVAYPLTFMLGVLVWPGEVSLIGVVSGYWLARLLSVFIGIKLIRQIGGVVSRFKPDQKALSYIFRLSWPMGLYLLIFTAYDRSVDSLMIRNFWGAAEVGWYGLAYKVYGNLLQPAYFFVSNIFPLLSSRQGNKKELFWVGGGILLTAGMLGAVVVGWLAPWIVEVLAGSGYEPAIGVLRGLVVAMVFSYLGHLTGFTLISLGGQKEMLFIGITTLMINLFLNWWAIPRYGIMGAAMVTALTEASGLFLMSWRLWVRKRVAGVLTGVIGNR